MNKLFRQLLSPEIMLQDLLRRIFKEPTPPSTLEEYCERLSACLKTKGGFSEDSITEHVSLTSVHLQDSMQEWRMKGLSEAEAWQRTLEEFGSVSEAAGGTNPIGEFAIVGLPSTLLIGIPVLFFIGGKFGIEVQQVLFFFLGVGGGFSALLQRRMFFRTRDTLPLSESCTSIFFWSLVLLEVDHLSGWKLFWALVARTALSSAFLAMVVVFTFAWCRVFAHVGYLNHVFIGAFVGTIITLHGLASPLIMRPLFSLLVRVQIALERRIVG